VTGTDELRTPLGRPANDPVEPAPAGRRAGAAAVHSQDRPGAPEPAHAAAAPAWRTQRRLVGAITVVGLLLTATASWTAWRLDRANEHHLLQVQSEEAALLVKAAITGIETPLRTGLAIETATGGNPAEFVRFMSGYTAGGGLFASATLWRTVNGTAAPIADAGQPPALVPASAAAQALIARAARSKTFVVIPISTAGSQRIGYALADQADPRFTVYVERAIPASRRVPVESDPAFSDLHFATYLGSSTDTVDMQTTDVAPSRLPLTGDTYRETIPFGDTNLTLMTSRARHLGGALGSQLPWILLIGGAVLTAATALAAGELARRRARAERDAQTITALYGTLDGLYSEQLRIAETLQHALLPQHNLSIPTLRTASRYVAGARGMDIGGDWYSLFRVGEHHFAFVVGDVSGRGVEAAALMARIRFTLRAYLAEGHPPQLALGLCSAQVDVSRDGHIATALVGVGDLATGEITLASAGHPDPLLATGDGSHFVQTAVGPPLGAGTRSYQPVTATLTAGSMLLAYTDGLIERRGEDLTLGFERLAGSVRWPADSLEDTLTGVLSVMNHEGNEDDIAILAFSWTPEDTAGPGSAAAVGPPAAGG
jgi:serine phosphatase RsbU (regulator of sigma subunit)